VDRDVCGHTSWHTFHGTRNSAEIRYQSFVWQPHQFAGTTISINYNAWPRRRRFCIDFCIDIFGVTNLSLAAQPCALPATRRSRPSLSIPNISSYEVSFTSLYLVLAGPWRLATHRQRSAKVITPEKVSCVGVVSP